MRIKILNIHLRFQQQGQQPIKGRSEILIRTMYLLLMRKEGDLPKDFILVNILLLSYIKKMQEDIHIEKESKINFFKSPQCLI